MDGQPIEGRVPWATTVPWHALAPAMRIQTAWRSRAACIGHPPDWFYPERTSTARADGGLTLPERRAKAVCVRCPVRAECLTEAIVMQDPWGVWGGTLPHERARAAHVEGCRRGTKVAPRTHRACRPIQDQVALLLARMDDQAERWGLVKPKEVSA